MNEPKNNYILSALLPEEYQRLSDRLKLIKLVRGQTLLKANRQIESLYFPIEGVVSIVSTMQDGSTTEIGIIGKEGMVGTHQFLGDGISNSLSTVQINGAAMQIDVKSLRVEYNRGGRLQTNLLRYALNLFNQVSQCSACNNHHTVKQRTARWLLMLGDRLENDRISIVQQFISRMLGVRRTGVSEIAAELQRQQIIDYQRGKIKILNREALEEIACECYQVVEI
ncbi:Crp/Fnr family transcriptional regulator [Myxosarcina sp. GI1]|uniref:Crp/Fnr family transcriptional regulator n=1 Tax=Myxosarcina sp. GI1 TaxID=1541065 RepID=UPI001C119400|nr:Crp/Fnr family transcriptional regulator [Myxosarcina sp. GI1]